MKRLLLFVLFVPFLASALPAANPDRHVVLITIVGFPAYLWRDESIRLAVCRWQGDRRHSH